MALSYNLLYSVCQLDALPRYVLLLVYSIDVRNALDEVMNQFESPRNKLVSIETDRAPTMMGKNLGHIGLLNNDPKIPHFWHLHCIIYCEHLVAKYFKYKNVCKIVLQIVNLIKINTKTNHQFKNFLDELRVNDEIDKFSQWFILAQCCKMAVNL